MIIVKLQGGLGNQMFQYSAGKALSIQKQTTLQLDLTDLLDRSPHLNIVFRNYDLDIFPNLKVSIATKEEILSLTHRFKTNKILSQIVKKTIGIKSYYKERSYKFDKHFNDLPSDVYLDGYWQSEKYFESAKATIAHDFAFAPFTVKENLQLNNDIKTHNSVCLNVRRGDFVSHPNSSNFHGFKGLDYINRAIQFIEGKVSNPHFYVFSDDIEWCRENIKIRHPQTIVDHYHAGKKFSDYLQLMVSCKHFIIPNSSFAWWAAWLNNNPNKIIIAPLMWFNDPTIDTSDIIPPTWIRL